MEKSVLLLLLLTVSISVSSIQACSSPRDIYGCLDNNSVFVCATQQLYYCPEPQVCIPNGQTLDAACAYKGTSECPYKGMFRDITRNPCIQFFYCLGAEGESFPGNCVYGTYFSPITARCTTDYVHGCSPATTTTQKTTTTTPSTTTTPLTTTTTPLTTTTTQLTTPLTTTTMPATTITTLLTTTFTISTTPQITTIQSTTQTTSNKCSPIGKKEPNPNNCQQFLYCSSSGTWLDQFCGDLYYNFVSGMCVPDPSVCTWSSTNSPTTISTTTLTTSSTPLTSSTSASSTTQNTIPTTTSVSSTSNSSSTTNLPISSTTQSTLTPISTSTVKTENCSPVGYRVPIPTNCHNYRLCGPDEIWYELSCNDLFYNNVTQECVYDSSICPSSTTTLASTSITSTTVTTSSASTASINQSTTPISTSTVKTKNCSPVGYRVPIPTNCHNYRLCGPDEIWYELSCNDFFYNSVKQECVPDSSICPSSTTTLASTSITITTVTTPAASTAFTTQSTTPTSTANPNSCSPIGIRISIPNNCHNYRLCGPNEIWYELSCNYLFYNNVTQECVSDSSVCPSSTTTLASTSVITTTSASSTSSRSTETITTTTSLNQTSTTQTSTSSTSTTYPSTCTNIGRMEQNPSDCQKYRLCAPPGVWLDRSCGDMYYNSDKEICVPDSSICVSGSTLSSSITTQSTTTTNIISTPSASTQITTTVSPITASPTTVISTTVSSTNTSCSIGAKRASTDCGHFQECTAPGIWQNHSCLGYFFDAVSGNCVSDPSVCTITTVSPANPSSITANPTTVSSTTLSPTTTSSTTSSCFNCSVGAKSVGTDCGHYQQCEAPGIWQKHSCLGYFYDAVSENCVSDPSVCVNTTVGSSTPISTTPSYTTVNPTNPSSISVSSTSVSPITLVSTTDSSANTNCTVGDKRAGTDCGHYQQCATTGIWKNYSCLGYFYDAVSGKCVSDPNVCTITTVSSTTVGSTTASCTIGNKRAVADCGNYQQCVTPGVWKENSCLGYFFDAKTNSCVSDISVCSTL